MGTRTLVFDGGLTMATPTQQIAELRENHAVLREGFDTLPRSVKELQDERKADAAERHETARLRQELLETRKQLDEERARGRDRDRENSEFRTQLAALRQRSDDQTRQSEAWASRIWGVFVVLVGALLSLASGLIVTLARK